MTARGSPLTVVTGLDHSSTRSTMYTPCHPPCPRTIGTAPTTAHTRGTLHVLTPPPDLGRETICVGGYRPQAPACPLLCAFRLAPYVPASHAFCSFHPMPLAPCLALALCLAACTLHLSPCGLYFGPRALCLCLLSVGSLPGLPPAPCGTQRLDHPPAQAPGSGTVHPIPFP